MKNEPAKTTHHSKQGACSTAIKTKACTIAFLAVLSIILTAFMMPTRALGDTAGEQGKGGYWQLSGSPIVISNKENENATVITEKHERTASTLEHTISSSIKYIDATTPTHWNWVTDSWLTAFPPDEPVDFKLETATFTATCTPPPEKVAADDYLTFHLTLTLKEEGVELFFSEASACALYSTDTHSLDGQDASGIAYDMRMFGPVVEGEPDSCSLATRDYTMNKQVGACDVRYQFHDPEARHTGLISVGDWESPTTTRIAFYGCGSITIWTYEWVAREDGGEWQTVVTPYQNQNDNLNAENTPGTQNSNDIKPGIVPDDNGFDPTWVVVPVGVVVIGGITYSVFKRRKRTPKDSKPDERNRATYKMVVYKNFGDTMVPGQTYEVCARIDKQPLSPTGAALAQPAPDPQLSSAIQVAPVQNIQIIGVQYRAPYMVARVRIPEQPKNTDEHPNAVVRFTYAGIGGMFNANVAFKVKANEAIVFCDEKGDFLSRSKAVADCLAGDAQETAVYFSAVNFVDEPQISSNISDSRIIAHIDRHMVPGDPTGFYYKVMLRWNERPFNQYDKWPYSGSIGIKAQSRIQHADGQLDVKAWYDGIGIDIKHLNEDKQFAGNAIVVDTADFPVTKDADYNIAETKVGVVAAYKNKKGEVEVFCPNRPGREEFGRVEPIEGDADSQRVFSPSDPRFWYDLKVTATPPDPSDDHRIGTASLKPFFPLLVENAGESFRCKFKMRYIDEEAGVSVDGEMDYIVSGLCEAGYKKTREEEIRAIASILAGMNAAGMESAYTLLAQYGGQSERVRLKLGNDEKREALAKTSASIMAQVNNIHSVQRLRFMREELFRAAVAYQQNDGLTIAGVHWTWQNLADFCDGCYKIALISRWAHDIMFSVWCYLVFKTKAPYIEPVLTPLKNWCLDYLEMLSNFYMDPDDEYQTMAEFFSAKNYYDKVLVPTIEGELFSIVVAGAMTHGKSLITTPQGLTVVGSVFAFMFANYCIQCSKVDKATGKREMDFWKALKKTTVKMTAFTLKVVLSVFLARKVFSNFKTMDGTMRTPFPDANSVREKFANTMVKGANELVKPLVDATRRKWGQTAVDNIQAAIETDEAVDFVQAAIGDLPAGYFIDGAKDIGNWSGDAPKEKDGPDSLNWLRSFGEIVPMDVVDENTGETRTIYVPILTAAFVFIDDLLLYLGVKELTCLEVDYSSVLPDDCPYMSRDDMIKVLRRHRIDAEAEWLGQPHYEVAGNYVGPTMDDHDSIVPQAIYHKIYR